MALIEAIARHAGISVGCYTSPHLRRYNERVRIEGVEVSDEALCRAFSVVEAARSTISLSYYEFGTLAALWLLNQAELDLAVLEVGLGGRLDAVNLVDSDCALITSIGIDHVDYLGGDRESIGYEKAAIGRPDCALICGDGEPPASVARTAARIGARLVQRGPDFQGTPCGATWHWQGVADRLEHLPLPAQPGSWQLDNAATVLAGLEALDWLGRIERGAIEAGLVDAVVAGRLQKIGARPDTWLDVAHNPAAATVLAQWMGGIGDGSDWNVVLGMLEDKDVEGFAGVLADRVGRWYVARLSVPRGLNSDVLARRVLTALPGASVERFEDVAEALERAREDAAGRGRILVTGSFHTVAEALDLLEPAWEGRAAL